jgi:hypothetical protein
MTNIGNKYCINRLCAGDFIRLGLSENGSLATTSNDTRNTVRSETPFVKVIGQSERLTNHPDHTKYLLLGCMSHTTGFWHRESSSLLSKDERFISVSDDFANYTWCRWWYGQNVITKIEKQRKL